MRKITFDVETKNMFSDVASNDPVDLDISVVCIHDSETGEYTSYLQEDFPKLWPVLEKADMLITFNGDHFDIPLLNKYYSGDLLKIKSLDLMAEVKKTLGRRIKLDTLAEATLGKKKSGHGLDAIAWWQSGEIDKIIKYCIEDVKITKDLYDYALKNGKLLYKDLGIKSSIKDIPLNTKDWEKKQEGSMTFTLPF
ncbi:MAG: ribonuclease H-like domain-containing protein [Patescibacteria group bacterium]